MWGDYSGKLSYYRKGNKHPSPGSPESPTQYKPKDKYNTHINHTKKKLNTKKKH